ncbi:MAG TPA: hypothetical protein VEI52_00775 [Terriglobales bacterium]|nr:hypothetical protein [Terriglobales bacterium]
MSQTAIRQVADRIDSQQRREEETPTQKQLANIHKSLEKIAVTLEHINSAMQKIVEGP